MGLGLSQGHRRRASQGLAEQGGHAGPTMQGHAGPCRAMQGQPCRAMQGLLAGPGPCRATQGHTGSQGPGPQGFPGPPRVDFFGLGFRTQGHTGDRVQGVRAGQPSSAAPLAGALASKARPQPPTFLIPPRQQRSIPGHGIQMGFFLITPLYDAKRKGAVLVNRGWVPRSWEDDIEMLQKSCPGQVRRGRAGSVCWPLGLKP